MRRPRKIFIIFAVVFALLLAYASYDIARRTTFPGGAGNGKSAADPDSLRDHPVTPDTTLSRH